MRLRIKARLKTKFKCFRRKNEWLVDLLEDHPLEFSLSLALILFGTVSLIRGFQYTPRSINILPFALIAVYCVLSLIGGLSVILGLITRVKFGWAYGVERFGLFISASAWGSYVVGLTLSPITVTSTLIMLALAAFSVGCLLRARAINRKETATLLALRYVQNVEGDFDG